MGENDLYLYDECWLNQVVNISKVGHLWVGYDLDSSV